MTTAHVPYAGAATAIVLPLEPAGVGGSDGLTTAGRHLEGPVEIAGLGMELWLPLDVYTDNAVIGIGGVGASTADGGPWADVPLRSPGADGWAARMAQGRELAAPDPGRRFR